MTTRLALAAMFLFLLCLPVSGQQLGQSAATLPLRTLMVDRPSGKDPIEIVKVMEDGTDLQGDGREFPNRYIWEATFHAGDDWIGNISFRVKNVSSKSIVLVGVQSILHRTGDILGEMANRAQTVAVAVNTVGRRPEHALYSTALKRSLVADSRPGFELAPGQEFTMPIQDPALYPALKQRAGEVSGCNSSITTIFFSDGTKWEGHAYFRPAEQRGAYSQISFEDWSTYRENGH